MRFIAFRLLASVIIRSTYGCQINAPDKRERDKTNLRKLLINNKTIPHLIDMEETKEKGKCFLYSVMVGMLLTGSANTLI